MAKPGPKPKLTDECQAKIVLALQGGNFRSTSAQWAGVGARTFRDWMHQGELRPKSRFGEFRRAVLEAEKAAEIRAVGLVMKAAQTDTKHAEWWLSHRFPERWAEKRRVEVSKDQKTIDAEREFRPLKSLSTDELLAIAKAVDADPPEVASVDEPASSH